MRRHSFPLSENCHRHCQDCGLHPGWTNTTGTQCGAPMAVAEGDGFVLRITRTAAITTYEYPPGHLLNGSAWLVTAQRVRQRGVPTTPGPVRKTASFFEFSLCLSRACLGKMMHFYVTRGQKVPLFSHLLANLTCCDLHLLQKRNRSCLFGVLFPTVCPEPVLVK